MASSPCQKSLAADLGMTPSDLCQRTTLGEGDHVRFFPVEKVVPLMRITRDYSVLATMADLCGFDLRPRSEALVEDLGRLKEVVPLLRRVVQVFDQASPGQFQDEEGDAP